MAVLKNSRNERFAQLVASGKTQADAYREVYPLARRWKDANVHTAASRLNAKVLPRVLEIQETCAKAFTVEKVALIRFLADVIRTPVGSVDDKSPLAQEVDVFPAGPDGQVRVRIKMPSKLDAVDKLAKLLGYYASEKVESTVRFAADSVVMERLS